MAREIAESLKNRAISKMEEENFSIVLENLVLSDKM